MTEVWIRGIGLDSRVGLTWLLRSGKLQAAQRSSLLLGVVVCIAARLSWHNLPEKTLALGVTSYASLCFGNVTSIILLVPDCVKNVSTPT